MPPVNVVPAEPDSVEFVLRELPSKTVLGLGDVILDENVTGVVKRVSPEAPVPIVEFRSRSHTAGGAANVAANIAALGGRPILGGVLGADAEAQHLQRALENAKVGTAGLFTDKERPTSVKTRILAHNQQIVRLDRELRTPISGSVEKAVLDWFERHLAGSHVCVLSDYGKGVLTARVAGHAIALCQKNGVPVLVDPKSLDLRALQGATLIKPNKHEAERLVAHEILDDAAFLDAGRQLAGTLQGTAVLMTRGALGMSLFRHGSEPFHVHTAPRNVFDVTGAGDTVIGMLAAALAAGATVNLAVWLASQCAAIVVEKLGTASVCVAELRTRLQLQSKDVADSGVG